MVHSVYRLYPGKRVCAQCLQTTHSVHRLYVYACARVYIYIWCRGGCWLCSVCLLGCYFAREASGSDLGFETATWAVLDDKQTCRPLDLNKPLVDELVLLVIGQPASVDHQLHSVKRQLPSVNRP